MSFLISRMVFEPMAETDVVFALCFAMIPIALS